LFHRLKKKQRMDLKLNNWWFLVTACVLWAIPGLAQQDDRPGDKDYKDKKQFEKFSKRRAAIGAWQINQLREGALVVRLKTNNLLINSLLKQGDTILAKEKQLETDAVNLNTIRAYVYNYTFSKVYFVYSSSSDSLLTNLAVSPSIEMKEKFYLLAERDYAYNSSIGFVREDSARFVKEGGYGTREMAVVVKNKYGHQLKRPFPYYTADRPEMKIQSSQVIFIALHGISIPFNVGGTGRLKKGSSGQTGYVSGNSVSFKHEGRRLVLFIPKYLTYQRISVAVSNFDEELKRFYRTNMSIGIDKISPDIIPFLY